MRKAGRSSNCAKALAEGRSEDEGWRVRKDGSRFWAKVVITAPTDSAGQPRGFAKVTRDISETLRAPKRYGQVVESALNALVMVNPDGKIVLVNAQTEKLFGYARDELIGQFVELLVPERFRENHPASRNRFLTHPQVRPMGIGRDLNGRRKDGSEFPVEIGLNPIETDEGLVVLGAIVDITERKRAEETLRRANAELEESVHRLGETNRELKARDPRKRGVRLQRVARPAPPLVNLQGFSKELTHGVEDLRAHLTQCELPQAFRERELGILDGPMAKSIRFIQTAVARLSNIIDALLRLSRAGRVIYQRQCVDVKAIVARVVESLRATSDERDATLSIGELPPAVGDPAALERVFANLIGNALNYLDARRPGRIEVSSLAPDQNASVAELRTYYVQDNGLGISETGRAKIFQPFQRLHPQAAPGEGLGLAIVQRIIEGHGGTIWFESTVGQGTTFFVSLAPFSDEPSLASTSVAPSSEDHHDS